MEIVNSEIERYLDELYGKRHEVLVEMGVEAQRRSFPIVGPLVGRLLYQLAKMVNARRVFEMGSGYGYKEFNRRLFSMKEFAASIVPVRDGVAVAYKL